LASSPPWAESTSGQVYRLQKIEACAGPAGQPPCLLLQDFDAPNCSNLSTYTDRSGTVFHGNVVTVTNWTINTGLMQSVEGDYAIRLSDGRTLTGHLRVCLLARLNFA